MSGKSRAKRRRARFGRWQRETLNQMPRWFRNRLYEVGQRNDYLVEDLCVWCQLPVFPELRSVEHIQPVSLGGDSSWENKALACRFCNTARGVTPLLHFLLQRQLGQKTYWTTAQKRKAMRRGTWNLYNPTQRIQNQ